MNPNFVPTPEQVAALERHIGVDGRVFYKAQSATDEDTRYYIRWRPGHYWPRCSCRDMGFSCWHTHTAMYLEAQYQEALKNGQVEAESREVQAVKRFGADAYQPTPFSLLKAS